MDFQIGFSDSAQIPAETILVQNFIFLIVYINVPYSTTVRAYFIRNQKLSITIETHSRWFQTKLSNCKCTLYLILVENRPVGQVRFDVEENFARIDYSIAKQFRGRKIGKTLLKEAISKYWSRNKIKLLGEVMPHNIASEKIFKSLGFRMKTEGDNKIFMKEANQPRKKNEKQKNINHCSSS